MSNSFHLAIPAGDLKKAEAFYTDILGCKTGNREDGKWVDIDFWGNELTLASNIYEASKRKTRRRYGPSSSSTFWSAFKKRYF